MYRYMCTAVENASKDDFYSTVEALKKIYPDCKEDSSANFGNEAVGRVLIVSDGGENRICIRYEYETKKVTVMSERKIDFFKGKKVEEIRIMGVNSPNWLFCFLASLGFLAVNIVAAIVGAFSYVKSVSHIFLLVIAVLTALYTVTSVAIRSKHDITILGTAVIQIGGVKTIAASIIIGIIAVALDSWGGLAVFLVLIAYYGVTLVSLFLSWVIIMLMNYIILKMN